MIFTNEELEFLDKHSDILDLGLNSEKVRTFLAEAGHPDIPPSSPYLINKIAFYLIYMAHPKDWVVTLENNSPIYHHDVQLIRISLTPPKEINLDALNGTTFKHMWFRNCLKEFPAGHIPTRDEAIGALEKEYDSYGSVAFDRGIWNEILRHCVIELDSSLDPNLQSRPNIGIAPGPSGVSGAMSGIMSGLSSQYVNPYSYDLDSCVSISDTNTLQNEIQELTAKLEEQKLRNSELEDWRQYVEARMSGMMVQIDDWKDKWKVD